MYYEYPIEQFARSARTQFQLGFARMTMKLMPDFDDVVLEPSAQGLKILGASEMAFVGSIRAKWTSGNYVYACSTA